MQVVKQLKHPSIVSFYGVAVKFPKAGESVKDWYSDSSRVPL